MSMHGKQPPGKPPLEVTLYQHSEKHWHVPKAHHTANNTMPALYGSLPPRCQHVQDAKPSSQGLSSSNHFSMLACEQIQQGMCIPLIYRDGSPANHHHEQCVSSTVELLAIAKPPMPCKPTGHTQHHLCRSTTKSSSRHYGAKSTVPSSYLVKWQLPPILSTQWQLGSASLTLQHTFLTPSHTTLATR
jgi:hypothetical protein